MTDISRIAELLPEPADGTCVVLIESDAIRDEPRAIWRDDTEAQGWNGQDDEHWFDDYDSDPMCWPNITKYATAAYVVPDEPTAHV